MITMILQMTAATVLHILITALLWHRWSRHETHALWMKVAVGITYGLCSVASTHLGINYGMMILNVRDLGPLAAGLFFDPVSGVIAGLIGGVERYIAGTCWQVGSLTTVACSLSTFLAGILSAALNVFMYKGKQPPVSHTLFTGAVMEVFHMYAILLTNRDKMYLAYHIVKSCSVPMILFNALGLMACSVVIGVLSGQKFDSVLLFDKDRTPVATRFHCWLLIATLGVFGINHFIDYNFQLRVATEEAEAYLIQLSYDCEMLYADMSEDPETARKLIPYIAMAMDENATFILYDSSQNIDSGLYYIDPDYSTLPDSDYDLFTSKAGKDVFRHQIEYYGGLDALCIVKQLDKDLFLMIGWRYDAILEHQINQSYETLLADILLFTTLYLLTSVLVESLVVRNLKSVNRSLRRIIGGDLNEVVSVRDSLEFSYLSDDINQTVTTLKGYIDESEKRMEQELKMAAFIQESALPHVFTFPRNDFQIHALMKPARQVGGDFYDFFFTDINRLALVIADVSGKGIPAAMCMMRAKTAIVNSARSEKSVADILFKVNNFLCEGNEAEMFVTVWLGIIDLETGLMHCANAGHEYPVLCKADGDYELFKDKHGLVLAAMEDAPVYEYSLQLEPGDRLFVYTDGVPEAINTDEKAYGTERLVQKLNTLKEASQEQTLIEVHHDIVKFAGDAEQFDDITMMGFTYLG